MAFLIFFLVCFAVGGVVTYALCKAAAKVTKQAEEDEHKVEYERIGL